MPKLLNAVRVACSTTGVGTTLALGAAVSAAFQTAAAAGAAAGDVFTITIDDGTQREITVGTVGAGATTIVRAATPIWSSTGSPLNLSGSATISFGPAALDLLNPDLFGTPGTPQSGLVRLGETALAGCDWPSWRSAQTPERFLAPLPSRTKNWAIRGGVGTGIGLEGILNIVSTQGLSGVGSIAPTTYAERQNRTSYGTTTTAGTLAWAYMNAASPVDVFMGGSGASGFWISFRWTMGWTGGELFKAAHRGFLGLTTATAAPTNVNPASLTNVIGIAKVDGSNNYNIVFGGSAAQTPIDLGANFPAVAASFGDFYEFNLFSDPNDNTKLTYQVNRWSGATNSISNTVTGTITNSTPGTTLPATTSALRASTWCCNNTDASKVTISLSSIYCYSEN